MNTILKKMKRFTALLLAITLIIGCLPTEVSAKSKKYPGLVVNEMGTTAKTSITLFVGNTVNLKFPSVKSSRKVTWKTSKGKYATVTTKGKVVGRKAGTTTITGIYKGQKRQCKVTVINPYLTESKITIKPGQEKRIQIIGTNIKKWKSDNKKVTFVSAFCEDAPAQYIYGVNTGTATITFTGTNNKTYKCKVTVSKNAKAKKTKTITESQAKKKLANLKTKYPEGLKWNRDITYSSDYIDGWGWACAAFAYAVSDDVFGTLPSRKHTNFSNIKVGDIYADKSHMMIVIEVKKNSIKVAEGNYSGRVHWGRSISKSKVKKNGDYIITRYPKK